VLTVLLARGEVKTYRLDAERFLPLSSWATELDSMSLSPSGECVVMSSRESMRDVEVFRSDSGVKTAVIPAESARIFTVRWSPMEKLVAAADGRGLVRLFETEHWREVARYTGHVKGQYVNCVAWSPDGSRLATGGWDETIRIWNARDATTIRVIEGHNAQIQEIDWSPDGRRIASYAADRTLRIWDADSGDELLLLQGFQRSLSWSSDGQKLATAKDGQLHVLDASRAYELETRRQMTLSHASTPD
jgi:WD40 repeat protein